MSDDATRSQSGSHAAIEIEPLPRHFEDGDVDNGPPRCIGCGRFLRWKDNWNQCADCDTRSPEELRYVY